MLTERLVSMEVPLRDMLRLIAQAGVVDTTSHDAFVEEQKKENK